MTIDVRLTEDSREYHDASRTARSSRRVPSSVPHRRCEARPVPYAARPLVWDGTGEIGARGGKSRQPEDLHLRRASPLAPGECGAKRHPHAALDFLLTQPVEFFWVV